MTPDTVISIDQVLRDACDGGMMTAIYGWLLKEGGGLVAED